METTNNSTLEKLVRFLLDYPAVDGFMDNGSVKKTFNRLGRKAFSELAKFLGLNDYKVDFNPGGIAVSGDLTLRAMVTPHVGIYLQLTHDGLGNQVLYRTIKHLKDYTGGGNNYFKMTDLRGPQRVKELINRLVSSATPKETPGNRQLEPENIEREKTVNNTPVVDYSQQKHKVDTHLVKPPANNKQSPFPVKDLLDKISEGEQVERLTEVLTIWNDPKVKEERKTWGMKLYDVIHSERFLKQLTVNLWDLIPDEYKSLRAIHAIPWKADPRDEGLKKILSDFVGRDELRQASIGVNFDQQGIVATDMSKLIFLNAVKPGKKGIYCMTKFCFNVFGKEPHNEVIINEKFPEYDKILPLDYTFTRACGVESLRRYASTIIKTGFFYESGRHWGALSVDVEKFILLDLKYLLIVTETLERLGISKVDIGINHFNKAVMFTPEGKLPFVKSLEVPFILLMPLLPGVTGVMDKWFEPEAGTVYYDLESYEIKTVGFKLISEIKNIDNTTVTDPELERETFEIENMVTDNPDADYNWQLSKADYMAAMSEQRTGYPHMGSTEDAAKHKAIVSRALDLGFDVPENVLQDYPELNNITMSNSKDKKDKQQTDSLLVGNKWFEQHPEKILGEEYQTTNAFGKNVTKVRGKLEEAIGKIPGGTAALNDKRIIVASTTKDSDREVEILKDPAKRTNIEKVLHNTKKAFSEKALRTLKGEKDKYADGCPEEYYCFDQVMKDYNQGISDEEIKAWIWYKRKTGGLNDERVILNAKNGWAKYVVPLGGSATHLTKWLKEGIVCYFNGNYIPSVLYYSENIYEKQSMLLQEKELIIDTFGQAQYERQWKGLDAVKPIKLTLTDPDHNNRLFIKPDSAFAEEIRISGLSDGTSFTQHIKGNKKSKEPGTESLLGAFKIWLDGLPTNEFKKSTAWNIQKYYLDNATPANTFEKEEKLRLKQNAKLEGDLFFVRFLAEAVLRDDQLRIEQIWNAQYNGYVDINYLKIPVAFTCSSTFKNKPLFIRPTQREGLGFISVHGSGCVAYDVGLGKTMTGILALAQALEMGQCKRPFIVVPNQTYNNWLNEIRGVVDNGKVMLSGLLPQYQVMDLYNLGTDYIEQLQDEQGNIKEVPEYSISVLTYEGFNRLGFKGETWDAIGDELYSILNQGTDKRREQHILRERIEEMMGKGVKGGTVDIEDLGFDYMVVDEAHAMKKSFTKVKGEIKGDDASRKRSTYDIHSGEPSMTALRGFMVSQYILRNNNMRNVMLLTATPFTNSPLEIYSILALIGYQQLVKSGIRNIKSFFDVFIKSSLELVINAKLQPERKEIVMGFHNLIALQQLIFKFIDYKTGEDAGIQRPNKIVLPLMSEKIGGVVVPLPPERQVSTNLPMTQLQKDYMADVELYVTGKTSYRNFCLNPVGLIDDDPEAIPGEELDEANLSDEEQDGARVLRSLSLARQLALSPYLYSCNPEKHPSYTEYIESSPKLKYVTDCIQSVKYYHEEQGTEVSGQVIYMNAGVHYFPLIKEYLVRKVGFKESEVGIIKSGMSTSKKEGIKERFLAGGVKIIIGSASIKEGINLQNRATVLYNCWLDWNPTDEKQLEGRIWRYGNMYANVRIVHPLMEDSIDTFVFQKLQEKTSRINEIWYRAGRNNTLKLEEFNPAELKMGLVTNPHALAALILLEQREQIKDTITGIENDKKILKHIVEQRDIYNAGIGRIKTLAGQYKPARDEDTIRNTETIFRIFREYLDDERSNFTYADKELYDKVRKAYSVVKRANEEILGPRGLNINFEFAKLQKQLDVEIARYEKDLEDFTGQQAVNKKAEAIIQDRIERNYKVKSVSERVAEFAALNPGLLDDMMIYDGSEESTNKRKEKNQYGSDMESSADALAEMENLIKDMEAMEEIIREMELIAA